MAVEYTLLIGIVVSWIQNANVIPNIHIIGQRFQSQIICRKFHRKLIPYQTIPYIYMPHSPLNAPAHDEFSIVKWNESLLNFMQMLNSVKLLLYVYSFSVIYNWLVFISLLLLLLLFYVVFILLSLATLFHVLTNAKLHYEFEAQTHIHSTHHINTFHLTHDERSFQLWIAIYRIIIVFINIKLIDTI